MALSPRHELFVAGILAGKPQSQAYIDAGYRARGNAAESEASKLVRHPKVAAEIQRRRQAAVAAAVATEQVTAERVIREAARIAFADLTQLIGIASNGDKGQFGHGFVVVKSTNDIPEDLRVCIESIAQTKDGIRVKFHSKLAALDLLAKHLGILKGGDVHVHLGDKPVAELTPEERARRKAELLALLKAEKPA